MSSVYKFFLRFFFKKFFFKTGVLSVLSVLFVDTQGLQARHLQDSKTLLSWTRVDFLFLFFKNPQKTI